MTARLDSIGWALLALSALLAVAYGAAGPSMVAAAAPPFAIAGLKASGILTLALIAALNRAALLTCALIFGALGDIGLALGGDWFLVGAGAFLVGHLFYIASFLRGGADIGAALRKPRRLGAMTAVTVGAVALTALLVPRTDPLFVPLSVYTGVLTLMTLTALTLPRARWPAIAGAVLFFISDGFVAANMFHPQDDPALAYALGFTGWMLYWAGQAGLCLGMLNAQDETGAAMR